MFKKLGILLFLLTVVYGQTINFSTSFNGRYPVEVEFVSFDSLVIGTGNIAFNSIEITLNSANQYLTFNTDFMTHSTSVADSVNPTLTFLNDSTLIFSVDSVIQAPESITIYNLRLENSLSTNADFFGFLKVEYFQNNSQTGQSISDSLFFGDISISMSENNFFWVQDDIDTVEVNLINADNYSIFNNNRQFYIKLSNGLTWTNGNHIVPSSCHLDSVIADSILAFTMQGNLGTGQSLTLRLGIHSPPIPSYQYDVSVSVMYPNSGYFDIVKDSLNYGAVDFALTDNRVFVDSDSLSRLLQFTLSNDPTIDLFENNNSFFIKLPSGYSWDIATIASENGFDVTRTLPNILQVTSTETHSTGEQLAFNSYKIIAPNTVSPETSVDFTAKNGRYVRHSTETVEVTSYSSLGISTLYYLRGDNNRTNVLDVGLASAGFKSGHALYVELPPGFHWNVGNMSTPPNTSVDITTEGVLRLAFNTSFSSTDSLHIGGLGVTVDSAGGAFSGVLHSALLPSGELYAGQYDSGDSLYIDRPVFSLDYIPVLLKGDTEGRDFPEIRVVTSHSVALENRELTLSLPTDVVWQSGNTSDITVTLSTDIMQVTGNTVVISSTALDSIRWVNAAPGKKVINLGFDQNLKTWSVTDSLIVSQLLSVDYANHWIVGDGTRSLSLDTLVFSPNPFKAGYHLFVHLDGAGEVTFNSGAGIVSLGTGNLSADSLTIEWAINSDRGDSILPFSPGISVNIPDSITSSGTMASYPLGVSLIRSSTYQPQVLLNEALNVYQPRLELSQEIVLLQDSNNSYAQYGGTISVTFDSAKVFAGRDLQLISNHRIDQFRVSFGSGMIADDSTLVISTQPASNNQLICDSLSFFPNTTPKAPLPVKLKFDGNRNEWVTSHKIRTTQLSITPDYVSNFLNGDESYPLAPFTVVQDGTTRALIDGYSLIFNVTLSLIETSSTIEDLVSDTVEVNTNHIIFNLNNVILDSSQIQGILLQSVADSTIFTWHFVPDTLVDQFVINAFSDPRIPLINRSTLYSLSPTFRLETPENDQFNLGKYYRPTYFAGDPTHRPILSIHLTDDSTGVGFANRTIHLVLPNSAKWDTSSWLLTGIDKYSSQLNNDTLSISIGAYDSTSDITISQMLIDVSEIDPVDTNGYIQLIINNNSVIRLIDNIPITYRSIPKVRFSNISDTSQVFWIKKTLNNPVVWRLKPITLFAENNPLPVYSERKIYFEFDNSISASLLTDIVNLTTSNYDTLLIDSLLIGLTDTFQQNTLKMCLTGNPDSLGAFWISINSVHFRSVDPQFSLQNRRFLDGDETASLGLSFTNVDSLSVQESNPILSLPSGFPALFKVSNEQTIDISSTDTILQLTPIRGTINWSECKLKSRDFDYLVIPGDSLHAIRKDSIKVGGIYTTAEYDTVRHCVYDPQAMINSMSLKLVFNPLSSGDTLILRNSPDDPVGFTGSLETNLSEYSLDTKNDIIKIALTADIGETDTILAISNLMYGGFQHRGVSQFTITAKLGGETEYLHKQDTLKRIIVGKPNIASQSIDVFEHHYENALFKIIEDSLYVSLHPSRYISFKILDSNKAHWRSGGFTITSGYSDSGWLKTDHQPRFNGDSVKYYIINDIFNPSDSIRAFTFNDLILDDNDADSIRIGLSTNNITTFDTLILRKMPVAQAVFNNLSNQNLVFLKSDSSITIDQLTITDLADYDSLEIVIPQNLSLTWDLTRIGATLNIDSLRLQNSNSQRVLTVYSTSNMVSLNSFTLEILKPAISFSAPFRILVYKNGTVLYSTVTQEQITLGSPLINLRKNLVLLSNHDEGHTVYLPEIDISQDPYLLENSNYRFITEGNFIYLNIPDHLQNIIKFQDGFNSLKIKYNEQFETQGITTVSEDTIIFEVLSQFDLLTIDSIPLIVKDDLSQPNTSLWPLKFGLYDTITGSSRFLGNTVNTIQLVDLNIKIAPRHLCVDTSFSHFNLGHIKIVQNKKSTLLGNGREIRLTTNHPEFIRFDRNDIEILNPESISNVSNDSSVITFKTEKVDTAYRIQLSPTVDLQQLLASMDTLDVSQFTIPLRISISLSSDSLSQLSQPTTSISTNNIYSIHLPLFADNPYFNKDTLVLKIVNGMILNAIDSLPALFKLMPASNSADFYQNLKACGNNWPMPSIEIIHSDSMRTSSSNPGLQSPSKSLNTVGLTSRQEQVQLKQFSGLPNKQQKARLLEIRQQTQNQITEVKIFWDFQSLMNFNQELFHYIKNPNHQRKFFVGIQGDFSSPDSFLTSNFTSLEWAAAKVNLGIFNPLSDLNPDANLFFNTSYQLFNSEYAGKSEGVYLYRRWNDGLVDTIGQIPGDSISKYIVEEGLYLLSYYPESSFPIHKQIVKDTTKPSLALFNPYQSSYRDKPLTVSYESDTLKFREVDNFVLSDSLVLEYESIITDNEFVSLQLLNQYRLWSPIRYTPKMNLLVTTSSVDSSQIDSTEFVRNIHIDSLQITHLRNALYPFSKVIPQKNNAIFSINMTSWDAAGNEFINPFPLWYNVIIQGGQEGLISDQIFNYPNPFKAGESTTFRFVLTAEIKKGQLAIFNAAGDLVYYWDLVATNENTPGTHTISWNGTNLFGDKLATGVYFGYFEVEYLSKTPEPASFLKIAINNR